MSAPEILAAQCMCGHDHLTFREESVERCLECSCSGETMRCQNCGEPADLLLRTTGSVFWVCTRRCLAQIEYALSLRAVAA